MTLFLRWRIGGEVLRLMRASDKLTWIYTTHALSPRLRKAIEARSR